MNLLKKPVIGYLILILSIPVIALLAGGLISVVAAYWEYSNIVALFGVFGAALLAFYVLEFCKIKSNIIAILFVIILGFCTYCVHAYGDYKIFIKDVQKEITAKTEYKNLDGKSVADKIIEDKTGKTGLWGFLNYETKVGIITKTSGYSETEKHVGLDAWFEIGIDFGIYELGCIIIGCQYVKDNKKKKKHMAVSTQ